MESQEERTAVVRLHRREGYRFLLEMDQPEDWTAEMDEPEPLGTGRAPNAVRMLAAAVGHCLSASLMFCLQKSRVPFQDVKTEVTATIRRNERRRWRVASLKVNLKIGGVPRESESAFDRCRNLFEDYCIVTASVRRGIPVEVEVAQG